METKQSPFEDIRQILREITESQEEADKRREEFEREQEESDKLLSKLEAVFMGEWDKIIEILVDGKLANGKLVNLLQERGIEVQSIGNKKRRYPNGGGWELDILAINAEEVVVVEVKPTLRTGDVHAFVQQMEHIRELLPEYADKKIYGAVAYFRSEDNVILMAKRKGFFVIRVTGNSTSIVNEKGFRPRCF